MAGCQPKAQPAESGKKIKIGIDPVTRIEGHLKAEVEVAGGKVVDAHVSGGMYRGFEQILIGRDPRGGIPGVSADLDLFNSSVPTAGDQGIHHLSSGDLHLCL